MIYEQLNPSEPIQQGDIFRHVPFVDLTLSTVVTVDAEEQRETDWRHIIAGGDSSRVAAILPIRSVLGIVITQNCDAVRGRYIAVSEILPFVSVLRQTAPKDPKGWQSLITKACRDNLRLFYLPADPEFGFSDRMAADFGVITPVPRQGLEDLREHRLGRLNEESYEHFRETLSQFFRRYPYDEWYPLTREEFEAYARSKPEPVTPRPWQTPQSGPSAEN